jgi:hypothetical protein
MPVTMVSASTCSVCLYTHRKARFFHMDLLCLLSIDIELIRYGHFTEPSLATGHTQNPFGEVTRLLAN